ncbi:DNA-processing protein DprA [Bacillus sp. FJAT-45350]|uniref:DNA-processing protein DprA n=1 Tax=Bacillus sp. FJAT-45350 TaxID=2011014 RepID=UPI00211B7B4D|nr:DNA-processing protein DprA [Bacillus sp. FJAT-45350]
MILIHHCRGVGWKTINAFFCFDPSLSSIFKMTVKDLVTTFRMREEYASLFYEDLHSTIISTILQEYDKHKIKTVTVLDDDYPKLLKEIYDPPWVLYSIGDLSIANRIGLAVVGTRFPTKNGLYSLEKIVVPLIKQGWVVTSGLALGIDTHAHTLACTHNGKTIAILGAGFYHIYPKENKSLARELATNHLLLSEFPPFKRPQKWHFPLRNRIISGLSIGTLVVEAKEKSGALITADQALEQGREVFSIPGSILENNSIGTNHLIQQGAKLVLTYEDILLGYS